jgi:hypothetical protein
LGRAQLGSHDGKLDLCARLELQALGRLDLPLDALLNRPSVFAHQKRAPLLEPLEPDRASRQEELTGLRYQTLRRTCGLENK